MSEILRRRKLSLLMDDFERWVPRLNHPKRGERLYDCGWAIRGFASRLSHEIDQLQRLLAIEVQLRSRAGPGSNAAIEKILEALELLVEMETPDPDQSESNDKDEEADLRPAGPGPQWPTGLEMLVDHAQGMLAWAAMPRDSLAGRRRATAWVILRRVLPGGNSAGLLPLAIRTVGRAGHEEAVAAADFAVAWCDLASRPWPDELSEALERLKKKNLRPSLRRRLQWVMGEYPGW